MGLDTRRYLDGWLSPVTAIAELAWDHQDAKIIELSEKLKEKA